MQTIKLIVRNITYVRVCSTTLDILIFGDKTSIVYYLNILLRYYSLKKSFLYYFILFSKTLSVPKYRSVIYYL